ncbi:MAG: hypothetical protein BWY32_03512 [bacterium ADurb.Bin243]|nr:MAG: hypothetical protein BWY32_03512 [bacterium ADurb.Bin243]
MLILTPLTVKLPPMLRLASALVIAGSGFEVTALKSPNFSNKFDSLSSKDIFEAAPVSIDLSVTLPPESSSAFTPASLLFIKSIRPATVVLEASTIISLPFTETFPDFTPSPASSVLLSRSYAFEKTVYLSARLLTLIL